MRSSRLKVVGRALAPTIAHDVEAELLALDEGVHPGALDGGNVDEHIGLSIAQLDEAEAFCRVEELHSSCGH